MVTRKCSKCSAVFALSKEDKRIKRCAKCSQDYRYVPIKKHRQTCKVCGKVFKASRRTMIFCCSECRAEYNLMHYKDTHNSYTRNCLVCNKEFITTDNRKVYCSKDHYLLAKRKRDGKNTKHNNKKP